MTGRPIATASATLVVLVALGAALGAAVGDGVGSLLSGAGVGLAVAVAAAVHFGARTLAARTADARGPEFASDSVERGVFKDALGGVAPDALSAMALSTVLSLLIPDLAVVRVVLIGALAIVVIDLVVRLRLGWRARVVDDA